MLILDFDGTLTDAEEEGRPFRAGYLEDIAVLTGADLADVQAMADEFEADILANRGRFGWLFLGHVVAPASVDPYLRMMPVARRIFDHYGVFEDEVQRSRMLDGILYKYNYMKCAIAFRPGARECLSALRGKSAFIVTNSATEPVRAKVRALSEQGEDKQELAWLVDRVHGYGKKYVIDPGFDAVPESIHLPGLERPVLLRRRLYHDKLDELRRAQGVEWSDVTVIGDIFELDLSLPFAMGARVALMVNEFTPGYEREFLDAHDRGTLLYSMQDITDYVNS